MPVAARAGHMRVRTGPRDPELRRARSCYDHLAGDLAVKTFDRLIDRALLVRRGEELRLTERGRRFFAGRGIDVETLERGRRALCRCCLDWSERRFHLGGTLGAAILDEIVAQGWAVREKKSRIVRVSPAGERKLVPGGLGSHGPCRRSRHAAGAGRLRSCFLSELLEFVAVSADHWAASGPLAHLLGCPDFRPHSRTIRVSRVPRPRRSNDCCNPRSRRPAGHEGVGPSAIWHRQRHGGSGLFRARRPRAGGRPGLPLRPRHHARDPRRLRPQPARHRVRLSRHRQVDPYRAGRGAAQLAVRARQSRQPHQPYRPDRQGRDRHSRRPAGDRIPRRHFAVGLPAQRRALLRRVRRRPPGRDVRDPARAGVVRPADAARPVARDQAASGVPPVRHRQHGRASATPRGSITARSRSTRRRWTAGRS